MEKSKFFAAVCGAASLVNIVLGVDNISEVAHRRSEIRRAIYAKSDAIDNQTIVQAYIIAGQYVPSTDCVGGIMNLTTGALLGALGYGLARRKESTLDSQ